MRNLPDTAHDFTQFVLDNPGQSLVMVSGSIILTRALANLVRPRNPIEALALLVVIETLAIFGATEIIKHGPIPFYVRDENGKRIKLVAGKVTDAPETATP